VPTSPHRAHVAVGRSRTTSPKARTTLRPSTHSCSSSAQGPVGCPHPCRQPRRTYCGPPRPELPTRAGPPAASSRSPPAPAPTRPRRSAFGSGAGPDRTRPPPEGTWTHLRIKRGACPSCSRSYCPDKGTPPYETASNRLAQREHPHRRHTAQRRHRGCPAAFSHRIPCGDGGRPFGGGYLRGGDAVGDLAGGQLHRWLLCRPLLMAAGVRGLPLEREQTPRRLRTRQARGVLQERPRVAVALVRGRPAATLTEGVVPGHRLHSVTASRVVTSAVIL
jgi:hypothetical protein